MAEQRIGSALDALGVSADLDDTDMVADALVILKVVQDDGSIALSIGATDSRDWISQSGLLHAALEVTHTGYTRDRDD
jgi:hypothetical protein